MAHITIKLKDGSVHEFTDKGRSGGSYTNTVRYEGVFVIVKDEWDREVAYPASDVLSVEKVPRL